MVNPDPTIRDVLSAIRSAPRRLLDVRLSTIWRGLYILAIVALYVFIVFALGQLLGQWFTIRPSYYVVALVILPLSHFREWWRDRKNQRENPKSSGR